MSARLGEHGLGVAAVLFDEAHERHLDSDLGLALAIESREVLRPDLRLLVMSATIDGARFAGLLGQAPVVESAGQAHPLAGARQPSVQLLRGLEGLGARERLGDGDPLPGRPAC